MLLARQSTENRAGSAMSITQVQCHAGALSPACCTCTIMLMSKLLDTLKPCTACYARCATAPRAFWSIYMMHQWERFMHRRYSSSRAFRGKTDTFQCCRAAQVRCTDEGKRILFVEALEIIHHMLGSGPCINTDLR